MEVCLGFSGKSSAASALTTPDDVHTDTWRSSSTAQIAAEMRFASATIAVVSRKDGFRKPAASALRDCHDRYLGSHAEPRGKASGEMSCT